MPLYFFHVTDGQTCPDTSMPSPDPIPHPAAPAPWNPANLACVGGALGTATGLAWEVFEAFRCLEAEPEDFTHVLIELVAYGAVFALVLAAVARIRNSRMGRRKDACERPLA